MTESVWVVGAGGHAKVVADVLRAAGWQVAGLFDDAADLQGQEFRGAQVLGAVADLPAQAEQKGIRNFIVALGNNALRLRVGRELEAQGLTAVTAVHPSAILAPDVVLGAGTVIMPGVCINAASTVGAHVIVNTRAAIDHDAVIADGVHIAPGTVLCGNVHIAEQAFLGAGVVVIPGRRIGARACIGAGACVVQDIPADITALGLPARPLAK